MGVLKGHRQCGGGQFSWWGRWTLCLLVSMLAPPCHQYFCPIHLGCVPFAIARVAPAAEAEEEGVSHWFRVSKQGKIPIIGPFGTASLSDSSQMYLR